MKLQPATRVANEIIDALWPECIQIQVAGSIRRHKPDVKDVEIVYISKTSPQQVDLFGAVTQLCFHTDQTLTTLIDNGILIKDPKVKRWGSRYKRAIHCASGIIIELFRACPDNWGYILALRTGPADFNKMLVTSTTKAGALPSHIILQGGLVWHGSTRVPTPTEYDFFTTLNLPYIPPQERTVERLRRCIKERKNR